MNPNTQLAKAQPAPSKPSALAVMAGRFSVEPAKLLDTLKATVFKNASNEELLALVTVANEYSLNPFLKEIYAFPAKGGGIVPIVSVDGWNKMLIRQPDFDGIDFEFEHTNEGELISCTAVIHVKNRTRPVRITEYLAECKRNTEPWNNMPHRMLRNRTLCQASRVAFGFSGVHNEDEASAIVVDSTVITQAPPKMIPAAPQGEQAPKARTPQEDLEAVVIEAGFTFDTVQKWGVESGNIDGADALSGFADIPKDVAKRLLRSKDGFLAGLAQIGGVQ